MPVQRSVVVCDDHPLFRRGVLNCLTAMSDINVVAEAADGEVCIAKLKMFRPDILITDLAMPLMNGFEILAWAREHQPELITFVLSMHRELGYLQETQDLGAQGFIAKEDAQAELVAAIENIGNGFYISESVGRRSVENIPAPRDDALMALLRTVSNAEQKVLLLLTRSLTSREIAEQLHISPRTVQAHRLSLAKKLNARGPNKLLEFALKHRDEILSR